MRCERSIDALTQELALIEGSHERATSKAVNDLTAVIKATSPAPSEWPQPGSSFSQTQPRLGAKQPQPAPPNEPNRNIVVYGLSELEGVDSMLKSITNDDISALAKRWLVKPSREKKGLALITMGTEFDARLVLAQKGELESNPDFHNVWIRRDRDPVSRNGQARKSAFGEPALSNQYGDTDYRSGSSTQAHPQYQYMIPEPHQPHRSGNLPASTGQPFIPQHPQAMAPPFMSHPSNQHLQQQQWPPHFVDQPRTVLLPTPISDGPRQPACNFFVEQRPNGSTGFIQRSNVPLCHAQTMYDQQISAMRELHQLKLNKQTEQQIQQIRYHQVQPPINQNLAHHRPTQPTQQRLRNTPTYHNPNQPQQPPSNSASPNRGHDTPQRQQQPAPPNPKPRTDAAVQVGHTSASGKAPLNNIFDNFHNMFDSKAAETSQNTPPKHKSNLTASSKMNHSLSDLRAVCTISPTPSKEDPTFDIAMLAKKLSFYKQTAGSDDTSSSAPPRTRSVTSSIGHSASTSTGSAPHKKKSQ